MRQCEECGSVPARRCDNPACVTALCERHLLRFEISDARGIHMGLFCSRACFNAVRLRHLPLSEEAAMGCLVTLVMLVVYLLVVSRFL